MRFFRRRRKISLLGEEDIARHRALIAEIDAELRKDDFLKVYELSVKCIRELKKRDSYGEAYCNYTAGRALIAQYLTATSPADILDKPMPWADHKKARKHVDKALELYSILAWKATRKHNKDFERTCKLQEAMVLIDLALLESYVRKWNSAIRAAAKSLMICRKYGDEKEIQIAARTLHNAKEKLLYSAVKQWLAAHGYKG